MTFREGDDLTFREREESRKLRSELAAKRSKGEIDLKIKNGRIVKIDQPFCDGLAADRHPSTEGAVSLT